MTFTIKNPFKGKLRRIGATAGALCLAAVVLAACSQPTDASQATAQAITQQVAKKLTAAVPYPLSGMSNSAERANLKARLLRMNDPNKIGYVYELTQNGQVLAFYTIKGKVSSTQSQLTNTQDVSCNNAGISSCQVVASIGDDGSYGPEEGGQNGIFFFTTGGVLVEYNGLWQYSDSPLHLATPPLLTINANAAPTTPPPAGGQAPGN